MQDKLIEIVKEHLQLYPETGIIAMMTIIHNCIYKLFIKDESKKV